MAPGDEDAAVGEQRGRVDRSERSAIGPVGPNVPVTGS